MQTITEQAISTEVIKEAEGDFPKIRAVASTVGPREAADGRRFWYTESALEEAANKVNEKSIPMFVNHDSLQLPVGEWKMAVLEGDKLIMEGTIYNQEVATVLKNSSVMEGVSVGMMIHEAVMVDENGEPTAEELTAYPREGYLQVVEATVVELSVVWKPANTEAKIQAVESVVSEDGINVREMEKDIRTQIEGLSKAQATAVTSYVKSVMERLTEQSDSVEVEEVSDQSESVDTIEKELEEYLQGLELESSLNKLKQG